MHIYRVTIPATPRPRHVPGPRTPAHGHEGECLEKCPCLRSVPEGPPPPEPHPAEPSRASRARVIVSSGVRWVGGAVIRSRIGPASRTRPGRSRAHLPRGILLVSAAVRAAPRCARASAAAACRRRAADAPAPEDVPGAGGTQRVRGRRARGPGTCTRAGAMSALGSAGHDAPVRPARGAERGPAG